MSEEEPKKTRGKYSTKRSQKLEKLLEVAKEFTVENGKPKTSIRYSVEEMTEGVCIYPNRYLDNDNTCVACDLYEHCGCPLKTLGKKVKR